MKAADKLAEVIKANLRFSAVVEETLRKLGNIHCLNCDKCCRYAPDNFVSGQPCTAPTNELQRQQCIQAVENCPLANGSWFRQQSTSEPSRS